MGITNEEFDVVADRLDTSLETYDAAENDRQQVLTPDSSYSRRRYRGQRIAGSKPGFDERTHRNDPSRPDPRL